MSEQRDQVLSAVANKPARRNRAVGRVGKLFTVISERILLLGIPSPTHSFIPGLKPSFLQILPTAALPFSSSGFTTWIPQTVYCYF